MTRAYVEPPAGWLAADPSASGRAALIAAAEDIVGRGLWCVVEVCVDVPRQEWEPRLAIFRRSGAGVADAVAEWLSSAPGQDIRLNGCRRTDLRAMRDAPTHLCYVAGVEELAA